MKKLLVITFLCSLNLQANFLATKWDLVKFVGERWQSKWYEEHQDLKDKYQSFYKGYAEGMFYECDAKGQSYIYNTYTPDEFFSNPEMELFKKNKEELNFSEENIFVHRITCAKTSDALYPFVTQEKNKNAFYQFEGGIYVLRDCECW